MALRLSTGLRNMLLGTASFKTIMQNGVIRIFPGVQPASADDGEGASPLLEITVSSGAFTPGAAANGINFAAPAAGACAKASGEVWSGAATTSGTAGWFRFYANDRTAGATTTIDSFVVTMPAS